MRRADLMSGYTALAWDADSSLSLDERATVEAQRRDLWRHGIRTEPNLTRMAFEFAAVICMHRAAKAED
jgi:hypothetical protein